MIFFPSVLTPGKQFLAWLGAYCDFQVGCLRMTCIYLVRKQSWFSAGSPCLLNNALGFVLLMDGILKQPAIMVQDLLVAWGSKNLFRYLPVWGRWTLSCYDGRSECGQPCLGKSVSGVTRGGENFENGKVKCSWELLCTCCWWKHSRSAAALLKPSAAGMAACGTFFLWDFSKGKGFTQDLNFDFLCPTDTSERVDLLGFSRRARLINELMWLKS